MAAHATASQPTGSDHLGTDDAAGERLASETHHPPPLAERSLRRHTPEVGAVCGKAARTVLCGGRAMKRASLPLQRLLCCNCSRPIVAPSDGLPRVTNSVAIRGTADMPRTRRARRFDAFDPLRS